MQSSPTGPNSYSRTCQDIVKNDDLVKSISMWSSAKGKLTKLNNWQEAAMSKAIQKPFQLIQGPPGIYNNAMGSIIAVESSNLATLGQLHCTSCYCRYWKECHWSTYSISICPTQQGTVCFTRTPMCSLLRTF